MRTFAREKQSRSTWESHWQRLGELMLPRMADFTTTQTPGDHRNDDVFDGTPRLAARSLATAIDGLMKPKSQNWFEVRAKDEALNELDEVKRWSEEVSKRMRAAIYVPEARFLQASAEVDLSLVVFGTGGLFIGTQVNSKGLPRLLFKALPLRHCYILRNSDDQVDTLFYRQPMTARQAQQKFGDKAGPKAKEALSNGKEPNRIIEYVQVIQPRGEYDPRKNDRLNKRFASIWLEVPSEEKVEEGGFEEFPCVFPAWETADGEVYGRSPGMIALPDSNTANAMGKTMLMAGQRNVDPPLAVLADSVIGTMRAWPGGVTYFDGAAAKALGRMPIDVLDTKANLSLGREMQNDTRDQIWAAFFRNILQLPVDGPQMTATEIIERKEEFIRTIGPTFGRLEADYTGPLIDRVFNIMLRASVDARGNWLEGAALPEPPDVLRGRDIAFEYASPVEKVRKQIEAHAAQRTFEVVAPIVEARPDVLDNFDFDEISRDIATANGGPARWLVPKDVRDQRRQQRAEQQQSMQQLAAVEQMAKTADMGASAVRQLQPQARAA